MSISIALMFGILTLFSQYTSYASNDEKVNLVKNSSFEVGIEGYGFGRGAYLDGKKDISYIPPVLDTKEKYHGLVSLRLDNPNNNAIQMMVKEVELQSGKRYTFSCWVKASEPSMKIFIAIRNKENGLPGQTYGKTFSLTKKWQRYSFSFVVPENRRHYHLWFHSNANSESAYEVPGTIWIDALQVEEGDLTKYKPLDFEIGIENQLPRYYTVSLTEKFPVILKVKNNINKSVNLKISYRIFDEYFEKVIKTSELLVEAGPNSIVDKVFDDISPQKRGKFILSADLIDMETGRIWDTSSFHFAIIKSVKRNSFVDGFGVGSNGAIRSGWFGRDWTTKPIVKLEGASVGEVLDFRAEAVGDRWVRDDEVFSWKLIEPIKDKYDWTIVDIFVEEAVKRKIRILPVLGGHGFVSWGDTIDRTPDWVKKRSEAIPHPNEYEREKGAIIYLPPMQEWERFVTACVTRYKDKITHWQIISEPSGNITAEQYIPYLKSAYKAIKKIDPNLKVIGFRGDAAQFLKESFKLGGLDYSDAISFHPYHARLDWSTPTSAEAGIENIKSILKEFGGEGKELWNTELFYIGKPTRDDNYFQSRIKGHEMARRFFIDLASGVSKSFPLMYPQYINTKNVLVPNCWHHPGMGIGPLIPSVYVPIYNTLAELFEEATPVKQYKYAGKNKLYVFEKNGIPTSTAWNFDDKNKRGKIKFRHAEGKLRFLDIMGNPIEEISIKGKDIIMELTNTPFYILPNSISKEEFLTIMEETITI
jgi:hypothetical protein